MIDDRPTNSSRYNDAPYWNAFNNQTAWELYLGKLYKTADVPVYAAPARALDYSDLPPTLTFVGDLDPFLDETVTYCENLKKAGVPVKWFVYKGCYHGFDIIYPDAAVSVKANDDFVKAFKEGIETYFRPQPDIPKA